MLLYDLAGGDAFSASLNQACREGVLDEWLGKKSAMAADTSGCWTEAELEDIERYTEERFDESYVACVGVSDSAIPSTNFVVLAS
jgi:hypothetical protein